MKPLLKLILLIATCVIGSCVFGCGSKDTDPHAKIDAPGYYNGPMDARGGGAKKSSTGGSKAVDSGN